MRTPANKPVKLDDALTEFEIKKEKAAEFENSNWGKFINATFTWAGDAAKGFSDAWSPVGGFAKKVFSTRAGQTSLAILGGGATTALEAAQSAITATSRERYDFDVQQRADQQRQLDELRQNNPTSPLIPELEKIVEEPVDAPITNVAEAATWLDKKVYEPIHENAAAYLLTKNPDIIRNAREQNRSVWDTAREYANQISFGQAGFDLAADRLGGEDSMFNIDITSPEQRDFLFYEGDTLVGRIGKTTSGAADLGMQLFGDPLWVAGVGGKAARLALLDTATVREATGINRLWQQSYFVDGEEALAKYAAQQENYTALKDNLIKLEQDRIATNAQIGLLDDKIANPTGDVSLRDLAAQRELLKEKSAKLSEEIAQTRKSQGSIPTLAKGHDEFYDQILTGQLTAVDLVNHSRLARWGAMKNKMAEVYALAAKSGDKRDLIDVDLIAMGIDPQAASRLRARRESLITIVEDQKVQLEEFKKTLKALAGDSDAAREVVDESYASAKKLYDAYLKEDKYLSAAVSGEEERVASIIGQLDPRSASRFASVEARRANIARNRSQIQFESFRTSDLGRGVYLMKLTGNRLAGRYRPNNMVVIEGIDQADGIDELTAWLQTAGSGKVSGKITAEKILGTEFANKVMNDFITATTRAAKERVLQNLEKETLAKLLVAAGIKIPEGKLGDDIVQDFLEQWINFKDSRVSMLRDEGFYIGSAGDIVKAPLVKPELAYSYYITDVVDMSKWITENKIVVDEFFANARRELINKGTLIGQSKDLMGQFTIVADQMWRFGVLARLGYPIRNVGTEWLKFAIVGGMMKVFSPYHSSIKQLPKALQKSAKDWASNKYNFYKRVSLSVEAKQNSAWTVSMKNYPDYVNAQNELRKADIIEQIGDMEYNKFVSLSDELAENPEKLAQQPEFIRNAHATFLEMKDSQRKLAALVDKYNKFSKVKRRTGTMEVYGYEFEQAYAGTQGQFLRDALSSGPTIEMMSAGMKQAGNSGKWLGVNTKIYPDYPEYYPNLSNYIQNKVVNSPTALRVMELTNIEDESVFLAAQQKLIQDLRNNPAYRDEIMATGNYNKYKAQIADENKQIKLALWDAGYLRSQTEEFKSQILSPEEVDLLDQGILPERFGFSSPEYVEAAKKEATRLGKEYDLMPTPDFDEKQITLMSAIPLSKTEVRALRNKGIVPLKSIMDAKKTTRLSSDEFSAIISAGYIEAAGTGGHFSERLYRFYTDQELKDLAFKIDGRLHIELPWAKQTKKDYISENMAAFNENWGDLRGDEILTKYIDEQIAWADKHAPVDDIIERLTASELIKLGIGSIDTRTIEERYIDDLYELYSRYFPEPKLRTEIMGLKAGESISPERLRYLLMDRGDNLSPITGDLLIDETRKRALPFKRIRGTQEDLTDKTGNPRYELISADKLADEAYAGVIARLKGFTTKSTEKKPSGEWRTLTPDEQVKAIEANKLLRSVDKDVSMALLFREFRSKVFKFIGQIPEDNLVRWPFGATVYNNHIETIAKQWYKAGFEPTQADMYALHTSARARAITESRKYLYSAQRKLNGVGNVPFVSPFYQAALTGTKNWGRIAWNDPSIVARRVWMLNYINSHADYDKKNGNRTVTITMPDWIISMMPQDSAYRRAMDVYPQLKFDTSSFNLIFPGMRLNLEEEGAAKYGEVPAAVNLAGAALEAATSSMGFGPAVVIGVEQLVKSNPNIDQEWFNITGQVRPARWIIDKIVPSENITTDPLAYDILPPAAKRLYASGKFLGIGGVDSAEYARINLQIFMTYMNRMETGEIEFQELAEIEKRVAEETVAVIAMKGFNNLTLPFIPQFTGPVNTMIEVWREYQEKYKENALQEFYDDYPDWWAVTASMSSNPGGILSTIDAVDMASKHSQLVSEVNGIVPEMSNKFIGMILNKENGSSEFDPASRVWMYENDFFKTLTPQEAINRASISKGNYDYYKMRDARDIAIKNQGIKLGNPNLSSRNTSNTFVVQENKKFNDWLKKQELENPIWWTQEWEPKTGGVIQPAAIKAAKKMLENRAWMADQDPDGWTKQLFDYVVAQNTYATLYQGATNKAVKDAIEEQARAEFDRIASQNETWKYYYERFFDKGDGMPFLDKVGN